MMELTINGTVFQFNFGMGFMREVNKGVTQAVDGIADVKANIGMLLAVGGLIDHDVEKLVDVLNIANKGQNPRVTPGLLDAYIDCEDTDLDALFGEVLDFLECANATKTTVAKAREMLEDAKQKQKAANP
ncbi:MAG: tail assembly chaperone [Oscillospiraceae bacterium]